jgi:hypothetical protein
MCSESGAHRGSLKLSANKQRQNQIVDQYRANKIDKPTTVSCLINKSYVDQFHYELSKAPNVPEDLDNDRFGYGYFPFQFSFCDGESGIPYTPQDAFDFWQRREAVTMDFHLYCEGSLNIDDSKVLQEEPSASLLATIREQDSLPGAYQLHRLDPHPPAGVLPQQHPFRRLQHDRVHPQAIHPR